MASPSTSGRARPSRWSANPARARSTVARMVVGLLPPSSGEVIIDGVSMTMPRQAQARQRLRRRIQMIFQDPYASLNPRWRVDAIVAEPIRAFDLIEGERDIRARVGELLDARRPASRRRPEISRTSSPAASASASRSPARWRPKPNSSSATSRPRRSTSPCRRRSST